MSVKLLLSLVNPSAQGRAVEISVRIIGDEAGPTVETIDVDDQGNYDPPEEQISTASNATVIRTKITEVAEQ